MEKKGNLYLIPVNISDAPLSDVIPVGNLPIVKGLKHLIVENIRTARRFLKKWDKDFDIDSITFYELNQHTDLNKIGNWLDPIRKGEDMGVMSEAGCPAVADPGAMIVEIAQKENINVIPLVGPSSILMSIMGSGFNGQGFAFNGYLPIDKTSRLKILHDLERESEKLNRTEIFIETPYRNNGMLQFLAENLRPDTKLCVACNLTDPDSSYIKTRDAKDWGKNQKDFDKRPAVFLIYRGGNLSSTGITETKKEKRSNKRSLKK